MTITVAEKLTKDQELELGGFIQAKMRLDERIAEGYEPTSADQITLRRGEEAAIQLVQSNVLLVYKEASRFKTAMPDSLSLDDLKAAGFVGLWKAVRKYSPERGNKFSTMATWWIRQAISREVNNTHRLVRLPENRVVNFTEIIKLQKENEHLTLNSPEFTRLVEEKLKLTPTAMWEIIKAGQSHTSLNRKVGGEDESDKELIHLIGESHHVEAAEAVTMRNEMASILQAALAKLNDDELAALTSSFKMVNGGDEPLSPTRVRKERGMTAKVYNENLKSALSTARAHMDEYGVIFTDFFD